MPSALDVAMCLSFLSSFFMWLRLLAPPDRWNMGNDRRVQNSVHHWGGCVWCTPGAYCARVAGPTRPVTGGMTGKQRGAVITALIGGTTVQRGEATIVGVSRRRQLLCESGGSADPYWVSSEVENVANCGSSQQGRLRCRSNCEQFLLGRVFSQTLRRRDDAQYSLILVALLYTNNRPGCRLTSPSVRGKKLCLHVGLK
jgi:hypothetical protein